MTGYSIRPARSDELPAIQDIERRAATRFASIGLAAAVELPIQSVEALRTECEHGRLLVAADDSDRPVGFAVFDVYEDEAYLREIDVVPEHAGQGLGRRLIQAVIIRIREAGLPRLTLATYRDVPFNAPFYSRLGFRVVDETQMSTRLAELRREEQRNGTEIAPRVAMVLEL